MPQRRGAADRHSSRTIPRARIAALQWPALPFFRGPETVARFDALESTGPDALACGSFNGSSEVSGTTGPQRRLLGHGRCAHGTSPAPRRCRHRGLLSPRRWSPPEIPWAAGCRWTALPDAIIAFRRHIPPSFHDGLATRRACRCRGAGCRSGPPARTLGIFGPPARPPRRRHRRPQPRRGAPTQAVDLRSGLLPIAWSGELRGRSPARRRPVIVPDRATRWRLTAIRVSGRVSVAGQWRCPLPCGSIACARRSSFPWPGRQIDNAPLAGPRRCCPVL